MEKIYLDNNATTRLSEEVLEAMLPYYKEIYGNASSMHAFGREARAAIDKARESVSKLIGAKEPKEVIFTSGGTESDNFAIKGVAYELKDKGKHIITSTIEHHAVLNTLKFLEEKEGFRVTYVDVDKNGLVDVQKIKDAVSPDTILISIMYANNEVGTIEPINEIGKFAGSKGILFHTDAVQACGKIPIDVVKDNIDLLSLSAHKIHGPKGVGALYIRKGVKLTKLFHGGHHEYNKRAGTENVAGIVGLGRASELALIGLEKENKYLTDLRDRLQKGIESLVPETKLNGHPTKRLPNTLNISFEYLEGESIILNLDLEGIAVATGSACTSGSLEPSHVLTAMGVSVQTSQGSIRFSLSKYNTEKDVEKVLKTLPPIISRLRAMSPLYPG